MDSSYYQIYDSLFENYNGFPSTSYWRDLPTRESVRSLRSYADHIKDFLNNEILTVGFELRPDAKYFLLLNFMEMVVGPYYMNE